MSRNTWIAFLTGISIIVILYFSVISCNNSGDSNESDTINNFGDATYVGSSQCKSCHTQEHSDWVQSDHFKAMSHASDTTVLGDFNDVTFSADGVTSRFFKKEDKYFINTEGSDGINQDFEVLFTFGHYPLQQYLISLPGGRLQSTRLSWDSKNNKWFNQYSGQKIHHDDWLHWTGNSQNWNTMCASCHSTDLQKNYDFETDTYHTTYNEINVSCESCHGPGSNHIKFVNSNEFNNGERIRNSGFIYARDTTPQTQLNSCAPCHARKTDITMQLVNGAEIMDHLIPEIISSEFYHADGQIREENYEYGSFTQSKMFHFDVQCSNCHNPHSGKLKKIGNELCLSCHTVSYDSPAHHFHEQNSLSAQCVSCHMPEKTYMGNDVRRDHSFRVPRPDQSVAFGTPNTCNGCHTNQSAVWAADAVKKWYGDTRKYHFSDDLVPGSLLNDKSETHLRKLASDTSQPEIARATATNYLGNLTTTTVVETLLKLLSDKKSLVRYHAVRALENFPPEIWIEKATPLLTDKVKAVRIAAADLYHRIPATAIPAASQNAYLAAERENKQFLKNQTDFSVGNVMLADYELQNENYQEAIRLYVRGLEKDSLMNYARLNLSTAYNSVGQNDNALKELKNAAAIDPSNERIFYNLALLYYEIKDIPAAIKNFQIAVKLNSQNPSVYYNYGLLLQQQGKIKEAESILLKGFKLNAGAENINYALTYLYLSQKLPEKAIMHARVLRRINPDNPEYQQIFNNLGI